jgi:hypothetical protein
MPRQWIFNSLTVTAAHMKSSFHSLIPSCHYSATANSDDSTQFNSSAATLISRQAGIPKLNSSLPTWLLFHSVSSWVESTDGQLACLSWCQTPTLGLRPDFYYCQTVTGLLMWGALSDKRTGLSFTIAAGPRERSHSQVRVPWALRPYFTVSDLRLPSLSLPMTPL